MVNGKQKGKRGELELAHFLTERGFKARRTQQFSGKEGTSDVLAEGLEDYHIECKRTESLSLYKAHEQAVRDSANTDLIPLVCHRRSKKNWVVILDLDDFLGLTKWVHKGKNALDISGL